MAIILKKCIVKSSNHWTFHTIEKVWKNSVGDADHSTKLHNNKHGFVVDDKCARTLCEFMREYWPIIFERSVASFAKMRGSSNWQTKKMMKYREDQSDFEVIHKKHQPLENTGKYYATKIKIKVWIGLFMITIIIQLLLKTGSSYCDYIIKLFPPFWTICDSMNSSNLKNYRLSMW